MADHTEIGISADVIHLTSENAAPSNSAATGQSEFPAAPPASTHNANLQPSSSESIAMATPSMQHSNPSENVEHVTPSSSPTASNPLEGVNASVPSSSPTVPAAAVPAAAVPASLDASSSSDSAAHTPSSSSVAAPSPQLNAQRAPPSKSTNRITSTRVRPSPPSAFAAYSNLALSQSSHDTSPPSSSALHDEKAVMDALRIDMNNDAEVETLVAPSAPALRSSSRSKQSSPASSLHQKPWSRPVSSPYGAIHAQNSHPSSVSSTLGKAAFGGGGATAVPFLHKLSHGSTPTSGSHTNLYDDHDPGRWHTDEKEPDDYLHDPSKAIVSHGVGLRAFLNVGTLAILIMAILMLFMGYPLLTHFYFLREGTKGGFNLGGSNGTGQVPDLASMQMRQSLIDLDTPASAQTKANLGPGGGETWNLMFSDEFNVDGRSFYPGDDPFWEAVNLYAHGTGDYEWYDPAAVTTQGGALTITVIQEETHNLNFRSGQLTSWNQMCFTGGYLEAAVILPGDPDVSGWWPAIWTMGNLGRANYGATTEGTWPYSYDTCDRGTLINQTDADGLGPAAAINSGDETTFNRKYHTRNLSWQPGQKLSACTCPGEDHPGPQNSDGTYKGRSAPEIDMFEAQISGTQGGQLSLSCQFMPANAGYYLVNETGAEYTLETVNGARVDLNSYRGSVLQMSASAVANTNQASYQNAGKVYSVWGFEYEPGPTGYVTWWMDGVKAWTLEASAVGADALAGISQRPIPEEPMYILMNVAISSGFGNVEWDLLKFPATMEVDYIRLYQAPDKENVGCDPEDYPTSDYINRHIEAYTNPNLTIWGGESATGGYGANWPRNRLYNGGNGCAEAPRNYPGRLRPNGILQYPSDTVPAAYRGSTVTDDGDD